MSCNGFNHPPDCDCGWGGVFHAKSGELFYGPDFWSRLQSHTNPNARCPVCGALVFFYRSPENGRVFFDSLGPPWPKHPCTSGEDVGRRKGTASKAKRGYGWMPFLCTKVYKIPEDHCSAIEDTLGRTLYLASGAPRIHPDTPVWLRRHEARGQYLLSTLRSKNGVTYEVGSKAFRSLERLRSATQHQDEKPAGSIGEGADKVDTNGASAPGKTRREMPNADVHRKPTLHLATKKSPKEPGERTNSKPLPVQKKAKPDRSGGTRTGDTVPMKRQQTEHETPASASTRMALAYKAAQEALKQPR